MGGGVGGCDTNQNGTWRHHHSATDVAAIASPRLPGGHLATGAAVYTWQTGQARMGS
jgi:hypothetical protein